MQFRLEWPAFIRRWGEVDGKAAAEHALRHEGEGWVSSGMQDIFSGWAATDPTQAAGWLNEHGESPLFDSALQGIVGGMSETDPAAATRVAQDSLPPGKPELAWHLTEALTEASVRQGMTAGMLNWYDNLPSTGQSTALKEAAFGHVWWRLNHASPNQAADWLVTQADKPWRNDEQYAQTTQKLAEHDPAAALNWAGSIPPSPKDGRWPGVSRTLRQWAGKSPEAAAAFARELPDSPFGQFVRQNYQSIVAPSTSR